MQAFIYGSRSYAKLVARIATECSYRVEGYIDDFGGEGIGSYETNCDRILASGFPLFLGIGYSDLGARLTVLQRLISDGVSMPNLIHPRATVSPAVEMGPANVVMAGSLIDAFCVIGAGNVFWPGSIVSHDSRVGDNSFFSPASTSCGFTKVGSNVFVGANAVIVDNADVPAGTFIKAQSLYK
jgi:carbonic anhydrase/acetyltransferase-like protein (isoleucine patch superfamily)